MKNYQKLKSLKKQVFNTKDAAKISVSTRALSYLTQQGKLERLSYGVYTFKEEPPIAFEEIAAEKLAAIPTAIIGYFTALQFLGLTDEPVGEIHLIVSHSKQPRSQIDDVILHHTRVPLSNIEVFRRKRMKITTLEQTLVHLLKAGEPIGSVRKIFEEAKRKGHKISLTKLMSLGEKFRAKAKVIQLMESLNED